ncbi:murein biosynthesis integral membrane protein MurJ [Pseudonocardia charpentierae]|uniref:Lipid II flippase MurJ n=1 Tax=Pseudonocardia charpentierae TaxID=3075545 RepID=A0ABU2NEI9_9PSEU|nr:lipid II flippase MurJ [Pseudonocardia sp. DSM 45834]MDT0352372.1 lipid II flippase MurJ [Pseudonocardia sp. DSM 45834]
MATLVSRLTGFLRTVVLVATIGLSLVNSSYTVANTLPVSVYQLLLGGVLSSVVVPVLVRAAREDGDGGDGFARLLLSIGAVGLAAATTLATVAAPVLVPLYLSTGDRSDPELAVAFAYLLLPQIFGYGMGALLGAMLNTRGVFGPAAWAPVLNNVVVLAALAVYWLLPPAGAGDAGGIGTMQLLVLGLGTTAGVVAQAAVLVVALRRCAFRWRWRWTWDRRLSAFAGSAAWVLAYVLAGQVGLAVTNRVASAADEGAIAVYANAWLLLQVPYGVLGVSLLTVLMPRMSAAAAAGRLDRVVDDLAIGTRLCTITLLPVAVGFTAFGPALGVALFSWGRSGVEAATVLGETVAVSAFGLLPLAVVMLQLRVFYALDDARTPTLIMLVMTAFRVPAALLAPQVLSAERVVLGLAAVNAAAFGVGAVVGWAWLRVRLGPLHTRATLSVIVRTGVSAALALPAVLAVDRLLGAASTAVTAGRTLVIAAVVGTAVYLTLIWLLRVPFPRYRGSGPR